MLVPSADYAAGTLLSLWPLKKEEKNASDVIDMETLLTKFSRFRSFGTSQILLAILINILDGIMFYYGLSSF